MSKIRTYVRLWIANIVLFFVLLAVAAVAVTAYSLNFTNGSDISSDTLTKGSIGLVVAIGVVAFLILGLNIATFVYCILSYIRVSNLDRAVKMLFAGREMTVAMVQLINDLKTLKICLLLNLLMPLLMLASNFFIIQGIQAVFGIATIVFVCLISRGRRRISNALHLE